MKPRYPRRAEGRELSAEGRVDMAPQSHVFSERLLGRLAPRSQARGRLGRRLPLIAGTPVEAALAPSSRCETDRGHSATVFGPALPAIAISYAPAMRLMMIVLVLGCASNAPEEQPSPEPVTAGAEEPDEAVAGAVNEGSAIEPILSPDVSELVHSQAMFEGWTIVPLAQLERDDRIVVLVWPAIAPNGQVVDDDIIGLTLQRGDPLSVIEDNWSARSGIVDHLGGEPNDRERGEGVPAELLAELLSSLPALFAEHVAAGDREAAVEAAISFSRLFAFEHAVESDTVAELLGLHTRGARIESAAGPERGQVRARFYEGETMVEEELLIATETAPNRWVFTDHRRLDAGAR
ncbi:MAG: hypothetical protein JJ863_09885 [Deltaproteobacteria bacterium]|nr:hypothetical protein [Deltaproteobacteria bacterium]